MSKYSFVYRVIESKNLRIFGFFIPLGFFLYADSVASFYFPVAVERIVITNSFLGIIMSLNAITSFIADFFLIKFLHNKNWSFGYILGNIVAVLFSICMYLGLEYRIIPLLFLASALIGVYFELLMFSVQEFVARMEEKKHFTRDWNIISGIWGIGSITGPILGSFFLTIPIIFSSIGLIGFQMVSMLALFGYITYLNYNKLNVTANDDKIHNSDQSTKYESITKEIRLWNILKNRIWPALLLTFIFAFIDSIFWTLAGVYGEERFGGNGLGWLVLFIYGIPDILVAVIYGKLNITKRKKFFSHISFIFGTLILITIPLLSHFSILMLVFILISSILMNGATMLNLSVYSDLQSRAKKISLQIGGLNRVSYSFGYIVGPIVGGVLADFFGYINTFAIAGFCGLLVGLFLLYFTPKKLRLPSARIESGNW